jgi:WD40 repeat protein
MFRFLFALAVISAGTIAAVIYAVGNQPTVDESVPPGDAARPRPAPVIRQESARIGDREEPNRMLLTGQGESYGGRPLPIVIPDARLIPKDKQEVPSERNGPLLVIGTEIGPGENVPESQRVSATLGYVLVPATEEDAAKPESVIRYSDNTLWRRMREGDVPEPNRIRMLRVKKEYKQINLGDEVKAGETVALVDPVLALNELAIKVASLNAAEAERRASQETKKEFERRVAGIEDSNRKVPGSVSKDDYESAKLQVRRYAEEETAKRGAVIKTQQELIQAQTVVAKHEIHAAMSGRIKVIYKYRGDAVKELEPVLQIQSRDPLRVEGLVDVQDTFRIKPGATEVVVEPTRWVPPKLVLEGHLGEVTSVAVAFGPRPLIISGSEDLTLRGWDAAGGRQLWVQTHRSAIRSVACTGPAAKRRLVVAGCGDGSARIVDLDRLDEFVSGKTKQQPEPLVLAGSHRSPIHCVAFSPDGTVCATGGDDRNIYLWNTETGERLHELAYHRAPVTSLQFTPRKQLVSAGRDNQLVVWSVEPGKPPVKLTVFPGRGGEVARIGASPDGKHVLFDQGKEIRMLSIDTGQVEGVFRNASGAANFSTMALFDPDGLTVLTNGAADGRLQLWRSPTRDSSRASELRQLIWTRGAATSAAFSPDASFCVTGMQDRHVLVWPMPERKRAESGAVELVDAPIKSRIHVEEFIDSSNRQVRVWAELENKDNRLVPGGTATMVVLPEMK